MELETGTRNSLNFRERMRMCSPGEAGIGAGCEEVFLLFEEDGGVTCCSALALRLLALPLN